MFFFKSKKNSKKNSIKSKTSKKTIKNTRNSNITRTITSASYNTNKLDKYRIPVNKDITKIKYWELPNRKHFHNWILDNF